MRVRIAKNKDAIEIVRMIESYNLPPSIFIKSCYNRVKEIISEKKSLVCTDNDKSIVGAVLVEDNYIDTICSTKDGVGSKLLKKLPIGRYEVNISKKNERSQNLFRKFGFRYMYDEIVDGQERGRYEGYIK